MGSSATDRYAAKRAFDIAVALAGLLVLWPVIALAGLLVALEDGRPVLYRQVRLGRDEKPFTLWKLRSMRKDTGRVPTHLASARSVTAVGRWLRRSKLDELPQLWNVLKGEMSLVGPRPCLPDQHELIEARRRHGALGLPVGITGLAQVSGYDFSTPEETAACDGEYARRAGLGYDLRLILKTLLGGSKDNADARMRR
jgi:O-antigen biosynthesis protein WbqP